MTPSFLQAAAKRALTRATAWTGTFYRVASPAFAKSADLINGLGAKQFGGRWSPKGRFAVVYASLDPHTALAESLSTANYYGWPLDAQMPKVIVSGIADLAGVYTFPKGSATRSTDFDTPALLAEDWRKLLTQGVAPDCHKVAVALFEAKLPAFIVPSVAYPSGSNIVIFPDNLRSKDHLEAKGLDSAMNP